MLEKPGLAHNIDKFSKAVARLPISVLIAFHSGYNHAGLHKDSWNNMAIQTTPGMYWPTRLGQAAANSLQQNVKQYRIDRHTLQTLWLCVLVLLSISRCLQAPLEFSKVLSDAKRAFSGVPESSCSYRGVFRMLWYLTYRIVKFWCSCDLCADLPETLIAAETAAQGAMETWHLVRYSHSGGS